MFLEDTRCMLARRRSSRAVAEARLDATQRAAGAPVYDGDIPRHSRPLCGQVSQIGTGPLIADLDGRGESS
jgi:hypothetical protein